MPRFKHLLFSTLLSLIFVIPSHAANFESGLQNGLIKKNAVLTEHFRIEFSDLVNSQIDQDGDGFANVVEDIAEFAEESWDVIIDDMGYREPLEDGRVIVVLDDRSEYLYPGTVGVTTLLSDGITPFISIDPWLTRELHQVTMAHELFHAVQFGYDPTFANSLFSINFAEASAVWIEDEVYSNVDDYYFYLEDFYDFPDYSVFAARLPEDALFQYALGIWPSFLVEYTQDVDLIKDIWEEFFDVNGAAITSTKVYATLLEVLDEKGINLSDLFREFSLWNLQATPYEDGADYPEPLILTNTVQGEFTLSDDSFAPALYGTNYLYFENKNGETDFYFDVIKPEKIGMIVSLVPVKANTIEISNVQTITLAPNQDMNEALHLPGVGTKDVIAIVSPVNDNIDVNSAGDSTFDIGYHYYYGAAYGQPVVDGDGLTFEDEPEKEGVDISQTEQIRAPDFLILNVLSYNADSVTFRWNRLVNNDISGYEIRYGTQSGVYDQVEVVESAHLTTRTIKDLDEGVTYFFQVVAVDQFGNVEGEPTQEIAITPLEWIFTDVSYLDPHYEAIDVLVQFEIFQGYPDGSFQTERTINRAELLKILVESLGIDPDKEEYRNCFPDVGRQWYARYVCYAKEQQWIQGYPDNTFRPGDVVNKVEALKMLFNSVEEDLTEGQTVSELLYPDLDKTAWYAIYVWQASQLGILEETPGLKFNPADGRNRGEMAEILYRYLVAISY